MAPLRATRRGFTLLEVVAAVTIGVLLLGTAIASMLNMERTARSSERQAMADINARYLADYLVASTQGAGGAAVRPWAAITVEDNCAADAPLPACSGTDRLTVVVLDPTVNSCGVASQVGAYTSGGKQGRITTTPLTTPDGGTTPCITAGYLNKVGVLSLGSFYQTAKVKTFNANDDISYKQRRGTERNLPPNPPGWAGGTLTFTRAETYFMAPASATSPLKPNTLYKFTDLNEDAVFDTGELEELASNVYDLQFALGYDFSPQNGRIVDTASASDEYAGNHPSDTFNADGGLTLSGDTAEASDMRMLEIGVAVGGAFQGATSNWQLLNGPTRNISNARARASVARSFLRNLFVFY